MADIPFMQLYIADYLGDTMHLTTEQHGAYLLLLMAMWRNGGSLPNDEKKLARIVRLSVRRWRNIRDDVMDLLVTEENTITQKRLQKEHNKATSKSIVRSSAGARGGKAKALKNKKQGVAKAKDLPPCLPQHSSETRDHIGSVPSGSNEPSGTGPPDAGPSEEDSKLEVSVGDLLSRRPNDGDWKALLFGPALVWLRAEARKAEEKPPDRSLLGRWLALSGDDAESVFKLIGRAQAMHVAEPVSWITRQLQPKKPQPGDWNYVPDLSKVGNVRPS